MNKFYTKFDENGKRITSIVNGIHFNVENDLQKFVDDGFIPITEEEQEFYQTNEYFRNSDGKPELIVQTESEQLEILRNQKISEFRKKLDDSDYYALKLADEALTAEEYEPIKIKRASWRAAINAVQVATSIEEINIAMEGSAE